VYELFTAYIKAVSRSLSFALIEAPPLSNAWIISIAAALDAIINGVVPALSESFTFAPFSSMTLKIGKVKSR
jgi:hypothetical protein